MFRHCLPLQDEGECFISVISDGVCGISDPIISSLSPSTRHMGTLTFYWHLLAPNWWIQLQNVGYWDCKTYQARTTEAAKVIKSCKVSTSRFPLWKPLPSSQVSISMYWRSWLQEVTKIIHKVLCGNDGTLVFDYVGHLHIVTSGPNLVELPRALVVSLLQWSINPGTKNWKKKKQKHSQKRRGKMKHPQKVVKKMEKKLRFTRRGGIISPLFKMQCPGCWDVQCKWPAALKATWIRISTIEVVKKLKLGVLFLKKDKS